MTRKNRVYVALSTACVSCVAFVGNAFALPGDPPTFDASSLGDQINDYASALLVGAIALVGIVLIAYVPFQLLRMGVNYIKKWFGARGSAATVA